MNPKKKAHELAMKFDREGETDNAIKCALIAVDEILNFMIKDLNWDALHNGNVQYWQEVKAEIKNL